MVTLAGAEKGPASRWVMQFQPGSVPRLLSRSAAARACLNSVPTHYQFIEAGAGKAAAVAGWLPPAALTSGGADAAESSSTQTPEARRLSLAPEPRGSPTDARPTTGGVSADTRQPPPPAGISCPGGPQPHLLWQPSFPRQPRTELTRAH